MFGSLIGKECRQILRSLVFYIYVIIFAMFMTMQLGGTVLVSESEAGQEDYGSKHTTDHDAIMSATLTNLIFEIQQGRFATYPVGFYKEVILSDENLNDLKNIAEECTGRDWDELEAMTSVEPAENLTYKAFQTDMDKVADLIGRGSSYEQKNYENNVEVAMTYEDAYASYEDICQKDGITDAYMRLFCDYAGIVLSLLPIFVGVTRCVRDRRSNVTDVIYSKSVSSLQIIGSRYLSNLVMIFMPVLILAFALETPYLYQAITLGVTPHYFAFLLDSIVWLMPTIAMVLALSFFLTELCNGIVAIVIQVFWAMGELMTVTSLVGDFGMHLVPRWNTFGDTAKFLSLRSELWMNRLGYLGCAIVLFVLTTILYDRKRRGGVRLYGKKH